MWKGCHRRVSIIVFPFFSCSRGATAAGPDNPHTCMPFSSSSSFHLQVQAGNLAAHPSYSPAQAGPHAVVSPIHAGVTPPGSPTAGRSPAPPPATAQRGWDPALAPTAGSSPHAPGSATAPTTATTKQMVCLIEADRHLFERLSLVSSCAGDHIPDSYYSALQQVCLGKWAAKGCLHS